MSTIPAVNSGGADPSAAAPAVVTGTQKTLGQDDFLKLLAQQFQAQDPMKPMDDTSFIAQMAQFTSLQQSSAMSKDMSALRADQQLATANSYLGHHVTVDAGEGRTASGDVAAVQMQDGSPQLLVAGQLYPLSAVLVVEPAAASPIGGTTTTPIP